ncbi:MAG: hypothetical protein IJ777_03705 [Clostridia bacterium]|nr:hypothetical protein [Clostridia bacterium]
MKRKTFLIIFIMLIILLSTILAIYIFFQNRNKQNIANDSTQEPIFSVDKMYFYSNANADNQSESKAGWDLNISQYTDIAIFLKIHNLNSDFTQSLSQNILQTDNRSLQVVEKTPQNTVTHLWLDNISFSNQKTGNLSLTYQNVQNFGKWDPSERENVASISYEVIKNNLITEENTETNSTTNTETNSELLENTANASSPQIDEVLSLPLTLRYQNSNLKTHYLLTDIDEPLVFDGSLLKRCRIPLSSIKNTVSCQLHIINALGEEYIADLHFVIPLQNEHTAETIYQGSYSETIKNVSIQFSKLSK